MRKKNTLYTVNKWNKPLFMPEENLFKRGGLTNLALADKSANPWDYADDLDTNKQFLNLARTDPAGSALRSDYANSTNIFGIAKKDNPLSKMNIAGGLKAMSGSLGSGVGSAAGSVVGKAVSGAISGGLTSKAGDVVGSVGSAALGALGSAIGGPAGGFIGSTVGEALGGITNLFVGKSVNEKALREANEGTAQLNSTKFTGNTTDELAAQALAQTSVANVDPNTFEGGALVDVSKENEELQKQRAEARMFADRSLTNAANNIFSNQLNDYLANYSAFGGPMETLMNDDMGAIEYGFMSDYLASKKKQAEQKEKMSNMFMNTPSLFADGGGLSRDKDYKSEKKPYPSVKKGDFAGGGRSYPIPTKADAIDALRLAGLHHRPDVKAKVYRKYPELKHADGGPLNFLYQDNTPLFAFGGDMQTNGADYGTGLTHIDAGGSHEESPYDGVQMGVDQEGVPNLVEEGEVVWDDYVFSNRIELDEEAKKKFHFPRKKDITYAEAAKKLEKEISERPNDPISRSGFEAQMQTLEEEQERQKQEMEAERAKAAFEALSPEEQVAVMENAAQQEQMAQEAAQQQAMQEQAMAEQPSPEEQAMMQQQAMQADGSQAMVGQEAPMMAEGGHLFPWEGLKELFNVRPPYAASRTAGYIPYIQDKDHQFYTEKAVLDEEATPRFQAWTKYVNDNWDSDEVQNYLRDLDRAAGGNHLFDAEGKILPGAKDYFNYARTGNHKWGYYHLTPEQVAEEAVKEAVAKQTDPAALEPRIFHALEKDDDYIQGEIDPNVVGPETRRVTLDNGDTVIYHDRVSNKGKTPAEVAAEAAKAKEEGRRIVPIHTNQLFGIEDIGPLASMGMMTAGIGRPDTGSLYSAVRGAGNVALADWMPRGDFAVYKPDDPWFYTSPIIAQSNATQRTIGNKVSPTKGAETLANSYNTMTALGQAQRQQLDSNFDKYMKVKQYNGTIYDANQKEYGQTSRFNANARNDAAGRQAQLGLTAAREAMDADAAWNQNWYGNIGALTKAIGARRKENRTRNMIADMAATGLFGTITPDTFVANGMLRYETDEERRKRLSQSAAEGGSIRRKKGKRGLTL